MNVPSAVDRRQVFSVWGGLMFAIGLILLLSYSLVVAFAQESVLQRAFISDAAPQVEQVEVVDPAIDFPLSEARLTAGRLTPVRVSGVVSDPDGCSDLQNIRVRLYLSSVGPDCVPGSASCVEAVSNQFTTCIPGGTLADFAVNVDVPFFVTPTDAGSPSSTLVWLASAVVSDTEGLTGQRTSNEFELMSLIALDSSDSVDFGKVARGADAQREPIVVTNIGNREFDVGVSAGDGFLCAGNASNMQSVTISQLHFTRSESEAWDAAEAIPDQQQAQSPNVQKTGQTPITNLQKTTDTIGYLPIQMAVPTQAFGPGSMNLYALFRAPDNVVEGDCRTRIGLTAILI